MLLLTIDDISMYLDKSANVSLCECASECSLALSKYLQLVNHRDTNTNNPYLRCLILL